MLAKEPAPGRVKTRLCPPLTPDLAMRCHEAFVADSLARFRAAGPDVETLLAVSPARSEAPRLTALGRAAGWPTVDQVDGDLGARMRALLEAGVEEGRSVVLVGADTPDLPPALVRGAFDALVHSSVVLGPASDGGYYLVGCRDRVPDIFGAEMPWGATTLWNETLTRLCAVNATVALLSEWHDVDDWAGLRSLAARIGCGTERVGDPDDRPPAATLEVFAELRTLGVEL